MKTGAKAESGLLISPKGNIVFPGQCQRDVFYLLETDPGNPIQVEPSGLHVMDFEHGPDVGRVRGEGTDRNSGKSGPESGFFDGPPASGT